MLDLVFILAIMLRNWAIKTLGECYSPHIKINMNHVLKKNGPYRFVRHPIYLSLIAELLGAIVVSKLILFPVSSIFYLYPPFNGAIIF